MPFFIRNALVLSLYFSTAGAGQEIAMILPCRRNGGKTAPGS